jgi:hypothetical protein
MGSDKKYILKITPMMLIINFFIFLWCEMIKQKIEEVNKSSRGLYKIRIGFHLLSLLWWTYSKQSIHFLSRVYNCEYIGNSSYSICFYILTIENTASTQSSHYTKSVEVNTKSYCDLIFKKRIKVMFYASITHSFWERVMQVINRKEHK